MSDLTQAWYTLAAQAEQMGIDPNKRWGGRLAQKKTLDELTEEINERLPEGCTVEEYLAEPRPAVYQVEFIVGTIDDRNWTWEVTPLPAFDTAEQGWAWIEDYVTDSEHPDGDEEERRCYRVVEVTRKAVPRPQQA